MRLSIKGAYGVDASCHNEVYQIDFTETLDAIPTQADALSLRIAHPNWRQERERNTHLRAPEAQKLTFMTFTFLC